MLSPSLPLGSISGLWGNRLLQYIEANTRSPDIHVFFQFWYHSIPSSLNFCQPPIQLFLVLWDHPLLPHPGTPSNSSGLFPFPETSVFGNIVHAHPFQTPWVPPMTSHLTGTLS